MTGGAPVPPPRRRRRRERRPLPPKPGSGDDESEPEPHYSQLRSPSSGETSSRRDDRRTDEVEGPSADSEDEFVAVSIVFYSLVSRFESFSIVESAREIRSEFLLFIRQFELACDKRGNSRNAFNYRHFKTLCYI